MLLSPLLYLILSLFLGCNDPEEEIVKVDEEQEVIEEENDEEEEKKEESEPVISNPCGYPLYPPLDTVITSHTSWAKSNYPKRLAIFKNDTILPTNIVMLGNSLTEQGGNWSFKIGNDEKVNNRGIAGDNCDGALARLGEIICAKPKSVFVMIGTNDLWTNYTVEEIGAKINEIGTTLVDSLAESAIYVQTLMPLGKGHEKADRLNDINTALNAFKDTPYQLIDTYTAMAADDALPVEFTTDGVHLTAAGYDKWVSFLMGYMGD